MAGPTTLFVINQDTPDAEISKLAEDAAQDQTHLSCILLGPAPTLPFYAYGAPPYGAMTVPDNWQEMIDDAQKQQNDHASRIEGLLSRSAASGDVQSVLCATFDVKNYVARRARVCDVAYLAANLRESADVWREAAHGVLFRAPIGLMLNASPSMKPGCVLVAWNSSEACSRAVHRALPYLKEAEEVIIACFDPTVTTSREGPDPGTDVAAWLSHHGCKVTVSQYPSGGREIGQCIIDRAREVGADLVVMGAYGHARMIEAVFGGTTKTLMTQTDLPVLLAH